MDWIIQALKVLRELRDWADTGPLPETTRRKLHQAADLVATAVEESETREPGPLGPAVERVESAAIAGAQGRVATPADRSGNGASLPPINGGGGNGEAAHLTANAVVAGAALASGGSSKAAEHPAARVRRARGPDLRRSTGTTENPVQEIPLDQIDPHALEVLRRLRRFGYRAYLVGGCVRDLLLGLHPKDFDIATSARPEEVKSIFRNSRIIGRRFRLVHVFFRGGKIIETATFRANAAAAEDEGEEAPDLLIRRDNVFGTEEEDARRRDFRINGLFYDIGSGRIIDHVGGLADVETRSLKMIGDPEIRLREDPVRILRAIRISAKAGLTIDPELLAAMRRHRADLARCAPARLLEETLRLLRIGHAETTVRMMDETGILAFLIPEIQAYIESPRPEVEERKVVASSSRREAGDGDRAPDEEASEGDANGHDPSAGLSSRELLHRHLRALDDLIERGPISDAVVLGALLYAPIIDVQAEAVAQGTDRNRAMVEILAMIGARLALTRRLSEHLRQIFIAQRHFAQTSAGRQKRRKPAPASLARRAFFPDALDLYEVHARAVGHPLDEVERWRGTTFARGNEHGRDAEEGETLETTRAQGPEPRRRPRRRRGGRGRGRVQPA